MFTPESTITVSGWMLQTVNKSKQRQRAQALTSKGNEHAHAHYGERTTETAEFTLGGNYTGNIIVPSLGGGIIEWALTYTETAFPALSVQKDSAAGGGTFALPDGITLPARTIGIPSVIAGIFTKVSRVKQIQIQCTCQHAEEMNGTGEYGTGEDGSPAYNGMRDAVITCTLTGIDGKPTWAASGTSADVVVAEGWDEDSSSESDSNTAIGGGTLVFSKHFPIGTDADAANGGASSD